MLYINNKDETERNVPTETRQGLVKKNDDGHRVKSGQPGKSIKTAELNIQASNSNILYKLYKMFNLQSS